MAKKEIDKQLEELKKVVKSRTLVIGSQRTLAALKAGKIRKVYFASNCPEKMKNDIAYYSRLGNATAIALTYDNEELGIICKKPFTISVLGLKNE